MPMIGMMMSSTSPSTILPKAAPMITPTARSSALPRMAKSLNSCRMPLSPRMNDGLPLFFGRVERKSRETLAERGRGIKGASRPQAASDPQSARTRPGRIGRGAEQERRQPIRTEDEAEVAEAEKRDERDEHDHRRAQEPRETAAADARQARDDRLAAEKALDDLFEDMNENEQDRQKQRFV